MMVNVNTTNYSNLSNIPINRLLDVGNSSTGKVADTVGTTKPRTLIFGEPPEINPDGTVGTTEQDTSTGIGSTSEQHSSHKLIEGIEDMSENEVLLSVFDVNLNNTLDENEERIINNLLGASTTFDRGIIPGTNYFKSESDLVSYLRDIGNLTGEEYVRKTTILSAEVNSLENGTVTNDPEYAQLVEDRLKLSGVAKYINPKIQIDPEKSLETFCDIDGDGKLSISEELNKESLIRDYYRNDYFAHYKEIEENGYKALTSFINSDFTTEDLEHLYNIYDKNASIVSNREGGLENINNRNEHDVQSRLRAFYQTLLRIENARE